MKTNFAMAHNRGRWIDRVCDDLSGALGEYATARFMEIADPNNYLIQYWYSEVDRLLDRPRDLLNPNQVKTKTNFDRKKAFEEAIQDAIAPAQITSAKNKVMKMIGYENSPPFLLELHRRGDEFTAENLLNEMILKYIEI